jgi:hypothetical protein
MKIPKLILAHVGPGVRFSLVSETEEGITFSSTIHAQFVDWLGQETSQSPLARLLIRHDLFILISNIEDSQRM